MIRQLLARLAQLPQRACERRPHRVRASSEMCGDCREIAQEQAGSHPRRLGRLRISKNVGERCNAGEQRLRLCFARVVECSSARPFDRKPLEDLRQLLECQRSPRHTVIIRWGAAWAPVALLDVTSVHVYGRIPP